ncbi:MAG TPA: DUF6111 family protein [Rhizomicrobium sp.]
MIRILFLRSLLFATPFAIYGAYLLLMHIGGRGVGGRPPWTTLFVAGLSLVAASFVYVGLTEGQSTSGIYVPPHMKDGRIVPGHVEKQSP